MQELLVAIGGGSHEPLSPYVAVPLSLLCAGMAVYLIRSCWMPLESRPRWGKRADGQHLTRVALIAGAFAMSVWSFVIAKSIFEPKPSLVEFRILMTATAGIFAANLHDAWARSEYRIW